MPAFYKIDKERKLVTVSGSGVLTKEEVLENMDRLSKDPDFDPSFSQIMDFTPFTRGDFTPDDVRLFARRNIFSPESRRAMVVKEDVYYGLARIFQAHRELAGETGIQVFRNIEEAWKWLLEGKAASGNAPGGSE